MNDHGNGASPQEARTYPLNCWYVAAISQEVGRQLLGRRLVGEQVVCGYHGFTYAPSGECVRVPSQTNVPYGTRVRAFPVQEEPPFVWIWLGDPARAAELPPPTLP